MKTVIKNENVCVLIDTSKVLNELIQKINSNIPFAEKFSFSSRELLAELFDDLDINFKEFSNKNYHYDHLKKLHISESIEGYVWISTSGLVPKGKTVNEPLINSCRSQYLVLSLLFDKAIELTLDESVYDVNTYSSELLTELSPAIYHNLTFYIELFCKAYLTITKTNFPLTHSLPFLYKKTTEVMHSKKHDDSLFQILVLERLHNFVYHIETMPDGFKEHNIKYNANTSDTSVILFEQNALIEMTSILELSVDFLAEYYNLGEKSHYLEPNVYQRMLDRAQTEEKKNKIKLLYPHIANKAK